MTVVQQLLSQSKRSAKGKAVQKYLYMCYGRGRSVWLPSPWVHIENVTIYKNLEQTTSIFLVNWKRTSMIFARRVLDVDKWKARALSRI
jgi:hypothetical protein